MIVGSTVARAVRAWRLWLPAVSLAAVALVATEVIEHLALMDLPMAWHHIVSGLLEGVVVLVPVGLYVGWRRAARRERAAVRQLQACEALREDMTHMLVHDLKNPLAAGMQGLELFMRTEDRTSEISARENQMLQVVLKGQKRIQRMIDDLLNVAQADVGSMPLELETTDVCQLVDDAIEEARVVAEQSEVEISANHPECPIVGVLDAGKLRRVMDNLLGNAIKFTPRGGHIEVEVAQCSDEVQVTVRDSGEGIPNHLRDYIFEKFGQAEAAREGHGMSVGLGLAFCKLTVETHGGRIWVRSKPGEGSAFAFALPLRSDGADT